MIVRTEALVLKTMDFRETSRIVTFFTREYGKVKGVMKGIRKDPKKFGSNADKFSFNDIVFYRYSRSDLHLISQCDLRDYFFPVRQDLKKSLAASYILELVDHIMPVEEKNEDVYRLMMDFLGSLNETDDIDKLVHIFQVKILVYSGFRPHIDSCVKTGKKIHGRAKFSPKHGGLVSLQVEVNDPEASIISQGTVSSLLHIESNSWQHCLKLGLINTARQELKFLLNNFLTFHLGRRIRSARYLQEA